MPDSISQVALVSVNDSTDTLRFSFGAYLHNVVPISDDGEAVESTSQICNVIHHSGNETFNFTLRSRGHTNGDRLTLSNIDGVTRWEININSQQLFPGENTAIFEEYSLQGDTLNNVVLGRLDDEDISRFYFIQNQRFIAIKKDGVYYVRP